MQYITSDLAKILGITTNTIRRYEESGFLQPIRGENNYRSYNDYDIKKASMIRQYSKCGFSHNEISSMLGSGDEDIIDMYQQKMDELDKQIELLTRLRHWIKDNQKMIRTAKTLDSEYIFMKCPPLKYILYCAGETILDDKKRLDALKTFIYDAPEIQLIQLYKQDDFSQNKLIPYTGWALKTVDIEKFHLEDFISNNPYIETYPELECVYYINRIPREIINETDQILAIKKANFEKLASYLDEQQYTISGDIVEFYVNAVGNIITLMTCVPITHNN